MLLLTAATRTKRLTLSNLPEIRNASGVESYTSEEVDPDGPTVLSFLNIIATAAEDDEASLYLPNLHRLRLLIDINENIMTRVDPSSVEPLFALRQLQLLSIEGVGARDQPRLGLGTKSDCNITRLHILKCYVNTLILVGMIDSCRALEEMCVQWEGPRLYSDEDHEYETMVQLDLNCAEIRAALTRHSRTLRLLTLDTIYNDAARWGRSPGIGSSRAFSKLESLELEDLVIYGNESQDPWGKYRVTTDLGARMRAFHLILDCFVSTPGSISPR